MITNGIKSYNDQNKNCLEKEIIIDKNSKPHKIQVNYFAIYL